MENNIMKDSISLFKKIYKTSPNLLYISIIEGICNICSIYIPLIALPQLLVALLSNDIKKLIIYGAIYFMSFELFSLISNFISGKRDIISRYINDKLTKDIYLKPLKVKYEEVLKKDFRVDYSNALDVMTYECDFNSIITKFQEIITGVIDLIFALTILLTMIFSKPKTGSNIMQLISSPIVCSIICIIIILVSVYLNYRIVKKTNHNQREIFRNHAKIERKLSYYVNQIVFNFNDYGIFHIFNLTDILGNKINENTNDNIDFFNTARNLGTKKTFIGGIAISIITIFAYVITGIKILTKSFRVTMLFTYSYSIINFSNTVLKIVNCFQYITKKIPYFNDLSKFMNKQDEYKILPTNKSYNEKNCNWELINVSYRYNGQTVDAVSNITLNIDGKKRHALVGKNAAGKSTLILLLTGILKPTSGKILWNGIDISKLDINEYRKYLSVVFQDFSLIPANVGQNVSCSINYDNAKAIDCLKRVGLSLKDNNYELNTEVYYQGKNARLFSGGQMQKIAIARALYKDSLCFIADEPTASLDPISEAEIYKKMLHETIDKSVIFISHRMSSCKDCDDIIVMDNGSVIERGTHSELLSNKNIYSLLWNAQAKYYK